MASINRDVYLAEAGGNLMQPEFFTDDILAFHACEERFFRRVAHDRDYRLVIEVGCAGFRLIDAKPEQCSYLGVDINPRNGTRAPDKKGAIIRCDARRFFANGRIRDKVTSLFQDRVACILPFNFLGTMDEPIAFLHMVGLWNKDIVLSLFNTTHEATEARVKYYEKCHIVVERIARSDEFVRLNCSNGFEAFAFSRSYLQAFLARMGYGLMRQEVHEVFSFLFFRRGAGSSLI
ncbi:MAG: hypothetical protein WDM91_23860 [Rhizomicrobium sp.]